MALIFPPDVLKELSGLPRRDQQRILEALSAVAAKPGYRLPFVTELKGRPGVWRLRKGDWRAVYRPVDGDVVVDRIAHRREVY
jgi:mRNA-degrading endonuclease RelE of RelBE toxin-antitoxin system